MIIKEIVSRRSVREYRSEPVAEGDLLEIIKAAQFAPTAKGNRAAEFVVVREATLKQQIYEIVGQEFVKDAPCLIIPVTDTRESVLPVQDLSAASQNIFLQAVALGLGTVWKNVGADQAEEIKTILGIPPNFTLINVIPVGSPVGTPLPHSDAEFNPHKIHFERWTS